MREFRLCSTAEAKPARAGADGRDGHAAGDGRGLLASREFYHGVFAPNHPLRPAITALAVGNVGKQRDATPALPLPRGEGRGESAPNHDKPGSHDTSRIAWAKLMARVGEEFPLECQKCGGDTRLTTAHQSGKR